MPGVGGVGVPSLSEIQAWDVAHSRNRMLRTGQPPAEHWESSFTSIHRVSVSPGGTVWEGVCRRGGSGKSLRVIS